MVLFNSRRTRKKKFFANTIIQDSSSPLKRDSFAGIWDEPDKFFIRYEFSFLKNVFYKHSGDPVLKRGKSLTRFKTGLPECDNVSKD